MTSNDEPVDIDKVIVQEEFSYGDHELQRMTVYHHFGKKLFRKGRGLFIIYIHGGAWRDPSITDKSFLPTIRQLFSNSSHRDLVNDHISGFASVSYRLSSHPRHPQDPRTPATKLRDAKHPDHLQDVISSVSFLQEKYGFGSGYLLIGHSCGATMAFQTLLRNNMSIPYSVPFQNPEVIVGVAGIYDFRLLRDNNSHPAYQEFIDGAFGNDENAWDQASPAKHSLVNAWPEAKIVVLASSNGDELVDGTQVECMEPQLSVLRGNAAILVLKNFLDMSHDDIWEKGVGLAAVIGETLRIWEKEGKASGLAALKAEKS